MQKQNLIWTLLPNGRTDTTLRISAMVSPRLETNEVAKEKLGAWSDFWNPGAGHWSAKAGKLEFMIKVTGANAPIKAKRISEDPEPKLWQSIFSADTWVKRFEFTDLSKRVIRSFPVGTLVNALEKVYGDLAGATGIDLPSAQGKGEASLEGFRDLFTPTVRRLKETSSGKGMLEGVYAQLKSDPSKPKALPPGELLGFPDKESLSIYLADEFYNRPKKPNYSQYKNPLTGDIIKKPSAATLSAVPKRLDVPKLDFHGMVASVADFPRILRLLGLVVDLEVDISSIGSLSQTGEISLHKITIGGANPFAAYNTSSMPRTHFISTNKREFLPRPKLPTGDEEIDAGFLAFKSKGAKYGIMQIDADGSALKTVTTAEKIFRIQQPGKHSYDTPKEIGLPALRSVGLSIFKNNRGYRQAERLQVVRSINANLFSASVPDLWAEDLMRGYRVDVKDVRTGEWHSLCERIGAYEFYNTGETVEIDPGRGEEGYVKGASATSSNEGVSDDIYLHETLFSWTGWSLTVERPGKTIVSDFHEYKAQGKGRGAKMGGKEYAEFPRNLKEYEDHRARTDFKLETRFLAKPKSLPRLRYGTAYALRARVVDIAGNSLDPKTENWFHSLESVFKRLDPVISPAVIARAMFSEGESLEHLAIRSNYATSAADYGNQQYIIDALTGKGYSYLPTNDRFIAPPKSAQLTAELHGMFDDVMGVGKDYNKWFNIARREEGSFFDTAIVDITTGEKNIPVNGIQLLTPPGVKGTPKALLPFPLTDPLPPPPAGKEWLKPGDPVAAGQYVIHATEELKLPYLPDPIARGVALRGVPGVGAGMPNLGDGIRAVKVPGSDPEEYVLLIPYGGDWPELKPTRLLIEESASIAPPKWQSDKRILRVQMPKGDKVKVRYSSYLSGKGDDEKDLELMRMFDLIDNPGRRNNARRLAAIGSHWMVTPWRTFELVHAVQQPLKEPKFYKFIPQKRGNGIGDTFAMLTNGSSHLDISTKSTGRIDMLAEWTEPYDSVVEPEPREIKGEAHILELRIDEDYKKQHPDLLPLPVPDLPGKEKMLEPEQYRHEFGDTKYRKVNYYLKATTRFREYLPPSIFKHPINDPSNDFPTSDAMNAQLVKRIHRIGPKESHDIYNSARPAAPKLLYILPTFGWEPQQRSPKSVISRRCGGGLRIYLERPWYSSGDGELVGIVLRQGSVPSGMGKNDTMKPYVTQWGMDPIWGSPKPKLQPSAGDFKGAVEVMNDLTLAEFERQKGLLLLTLPMGGSGSDEKVKIKPQFKLSDYTLEMVANTKVTVVGYKPEFDPVRKLWYCDIEVDTGDSYFPFIRLALCRFQPKSIPNCHISPVVLADFAQIAPDRVAAISTNFEQVSRPEDFNLKSRSEHDSLEIMAADSSDRMIAEPGLVRRDDGLDLKAVPPPDLKLVKKVKVMVSGVFGQNRLHKDADSAIGGPAWVQFNKEYPPYKLSRIIMVTVETRSAVGTGWKPVSPELTNVELKPAKEYDTRLIWLADLTLPSDAPANQKYRYQIREYEVLPTDEEVGDEYRGSPVAMRIVYADTIET